MFLIGEIEAPQLTLGVGITIQRLTAKLDPRWIRVWAIGVPTQEEQGRHYLWRFWEKLPLPRHPFSLEVTDTDRPSIFVNLGPHPPRLWPEDVDRLHNIWLRLTEREGGGAKLHHRDVVGVALRRIEEELDGPQRVEVLRAVEETLHSHE